MVATAKDIDTTARTIYGEAEPNDMPDATAIAWVIRNRAELPNWPNTASEVCLQPKQFSCWNDNDPSRTRIMGVKKGNAWFDVCTRLASDVLTVGMPADPTNRATHYHTTYIKTPKWARGHTPCYEPPLVGKYQHLFYNDIDTPPPTTPKEALDQAKPLTESKEMQAAGGLVATGGTVVAKGADSNSTTLIIVGCAVLLIGALIAVWRYRARVRGER